MIKELTYRERPIFRFSSSGSITYEIVEKINELIKKLDELEERIENLERVK